jgi:hypothetical protein
MSKVDQLRWDDEWRRSWRGDEKGGSVSVLVLVFIYIYLYLLYFIYHADKNHYVSKYKHKGMECVVLVLCWCSVYTWIHSKHQSLWDFFLYLHGIKNYECIKVQLESATMSDPAIFWPRFSDAANGAPIVLYPIHI